MIRLFKRRMKTASPMDSVWRKLNKAVEVKQSKWALYLQQKTAPYSNRRLKWLLLLFCVASTVASGLVTWNALHEKSTLPKVQPIAVPQHIDRDGEDNDSKHDFENSPSYLQVEKFKAYMKQLHESPSGKQTYDSIIRARPGLMDSIALVEKIYQHQ